MAINVYRDGELIHKVEGETCDHQQCVFNEVQRFNLDYNTVQIKTEKDGVETDFNLYPLWKTDQQIYDDELAAYKTKKCNIIDNNTKQLILSGFYYEPGDVWFSTSMAAQLDWTGLAAGYMMAKSVGVNYPFPMPMPTKPLDGGNWMCPDEQTYITICLTMLERTAYLRTSGQDIKDLVKACNSKEDVDLVVDNRV